MKASTPRFKGKHLLRAFSLIELLVIVSIIAMLASLLAPVLAQVREQVRSTLCLSNLRQLGMGVMLYAEDYDAMYASPGYLPGTWPMDLHQPYLSSGWRVWVCPSDTLARVWDGSIYSPSFLRRTSYIWNAYVFRGDPSDWRRAISSAAVPTPSTLPVWGEGYANPGWVADATPLTDPSAQDAYIHDAYGDNLNTLPNDPFAARCPYRPLYFGTRPPDRRHNGGGNYVFSDGHAHWLFPDDFRVAALYASGGRIVDDRTDPFVTNGARMAAISGTALCPVFCCPRNFGMPPGDGERPWFRP
jgi:prepilin-type processing-associated H-X9-DG protein